MAWTADDLVAAVRVRAQMPDSAGDGALTDADIVTLANEEIALRLVPLVRRSRGDYYVTTHDVDIVNGTAAYRVPTRAQTSGLRELTIVDSSGREWPVPQMHLEDAGPAQVIGGGYSAVRFYMRGPDVVLVPTPTYSDCTLRMYYHRSHPTLVLSVGTGIGALVAGELRCANTPAWWSSFIATPGLFIDAYYREPPFGIIAESMVVTAITPGTTDTLTVTDLASYDLPVNVFFTLAYQYTSNIVDLPAECWPLLVSAVTARVCEVIGDRDGAAMAYGLYDREQANIMTLLTPRVEGNKQVLVDRFSTLRSGRGWGRRYG